MSWPHVSIRCVAKVTTGKTPSKKVEGYFGGDIPFISPSELGEQVSVLPPKQTLTEAGASQIKLVPKDSVLVCCIGSLGKLAIADRELGTNQQINSVTFDSNKVFPKFGYYALARLKPVLESMAPATTVAIVSKSKFEELEIPLPPLTEQKRIAAILDKADAIRRKRQQAIKLADEFLRAVFLDMFGDPVTNPKGWEVRPLSMLTSKITDGTHKTPTYTNEGVPFLSAKNIKEYGLDWTETKFISQEEHEELVKRCNPEVGDILLSKSGSLGTPAIVDVDKDFSLFESSALLKPLEDRIKPMFLLHFLRSKPGKYLMLKSTKGVAIKHLHLTDLRELPVIVPPMDIQESFSNTVDKITSLASKNFTSADSKETLFKSLSQKAFAGEL